MKIKHLILTLVGLSFTFAPSSTPAQPSPGQTGPYRVSRTLHIGGEGGWDYLTVDSEHQLLYVPRSSHTMVIDARTGKTVADIPGQKRNHGVVLVPGSNRGFITDGADGSVTVFDRKTHAVLGKVKTADDADGLIYDPASGKVLVVCGDAGVMIPISPNLEPATDKSDPAVELGGKPEFLAADGQGKAYVNLVDKDQVAVVDTRAMKVVTKWPTAPGGSPVGMSMDTARGYLFVGCRKPQRLLVMRVADGKVIADLPIGSGVDATKFDSDIFASCGDGSLAVARETAPGKFQIVQNLETPRGARTMGIDAGSHTFYLPTAEFEPAPQGQGRPRAKPDSFMIVVVTRSAQ